MDNTVVSILLEFFRSYILPGIGAGVSGLLIVWGAQWQQRAKAAAARDSVRLAHVNGEKAAESIEQMHPNYPPEVKSEMALALAQQWNDEAKINFTEASQLSKNEAGVFQLPATENTSNAIPGTTTTTTVVTPPAKLTIDDSKIPKG
jgi:hypothetical protein